MSAPRPKCSAAFRARSCQSTRNARFTPHRRTRSRKSARTGASLLKIFLHEFPSSGGITGVALLAESHMSIHTWPEKEYAAIDIFMCGHADTRRALDVLIVKLKPTHTIVEHFIRGDRAVRPRVKSRKASA